jgi:catechol 2,3-dioxygenase-like lactoylglutathione lyase family enzyme
MHREKAFSGFSVDDLAAAKHFYGEVLRVELEEIPAGLRLKLGNGILAYPKANHEPATYTMLNFVVDDIDEAVDALRARGVTFEQYENLPQDERGVMRPPTDMRDRYGPPIAWFRDPAGNLLAIIESSESL